MLPPLGWHAVLTHWELRAGWDLLALLALVGYVVGLHRAHRRGRRAVHPARVVSFVGGLVLLVVTVGSGIEVYGQVVFWVHMIEHLLLIMVVPALLVLGHPLTVLVAATDGRSQERVRHALTSGPVALLTHPAVGFLLYAGVIVGTHLTSFMDQMMLHPWLGFVEQLLYVGSGYLFLLPLIGNEPIRWHPPMLLRIFLLVVGMVPDTVVGIVLLQTETNLFPGMLGMRPAWAPDAVHDINIGGGIMWAGGDGLMMFLAVGVVIALLVTGDRGDLIGGWLEGVRRDTLREHLDRAGDDGELDEGVDVDDDEAALAAYNRMLARLSEDRESKPPDRLS